MADQNKTQATEVDPAQFLAEVAPAQRQADALQLFEFMNRVTGLEAKMWGPSIIGYGRYAYAYSSGRSGEFFLTGFSPRKANLSIYIMPGYEFDGMAEWLNQLGPHKTGKSCLYVTRLSRIDLDILEKMILRGLEIVRANYQTWDV